MTVSLVRDCAVPRSSHLYRHWLSRSCPGCPSVHIPTGRDRSTRFSPRSTARFQYARSSLHTSAAAASPTSTTSDRPGSLCLVFLWRSSAYAFPTTGTSLLTQQAPVPGPDPPTAVFDISNGERDPAGQDSLRRRSRTLGCCPAVDRREILSTRVPSATE